jgi:hypothetical protein
MKKNLFSVVNAVDAGNYVLFGPKDVKFLQNIRILDVDVVHTGKRIKDLFVLASTVSYVDKMSTNDGASIWHARLGHLSMDKLKAMVLKNLVKGLPMLTTLGSDEVCEGCQYGKAHRLPFDKSFSRCKSPLELIHGDLMGPCTTPSYSGSLYMLVLVDDYTQFTWVYFMKEKSEVFFRFKEFKATVESMLNKKIKRFRTDNGGEFTSINFNKFCQEQGIRRELSCAYTPQQNGVAERKIRHLVETCRSWLYAKNLPKALWAEGMACAAYVINRVPLSPINMKSPYELMFEEKPSVKHFKVFGSICYVHVPDAKRTKLDAKAQKCIFIGYDERKKGWECMDPETHKFCVSRDVVFDEVSSYYKAEGAIFGCTSGGTSVHNEPHREISLPLSPNAPMPSDSSSSRMGEQSNRGSCVDGHELEGQQGDEEVENVPPLRRSKRKVVLPARYRDRNFVSMHSCFFDNLIDECGLSCFDEVKGVKERDDDMDDEMNAIIRNQTWDLVPKPKEVKPITSKWVYKVKQKEVDNVDRYKAS